jgi:hypothetical protein
MMIREIKTVPSGASGTENAVVEALETTAPNKHNEALEE